jgi:predicted nucleic acid-binding protein
LKAFFDSSVLIAVFYAHHEHHTESLERFLHCSKKDGSCAAHSLAEIYSVLTGRVGKDRVTGDEALLFLGDVRDRLSVVTLNAEEYAKTLEEAAALGIAGGGVYDALLGRCAVKAHAETVYTWNVKHFERLGPEIRKRVKTP